MVKIVYQTGKNIDISEGEFFRAGDETISIYGKDNKLISVFYRTPGLGVVCKEDKNE